jgi:hypothetical protein
MHQNLMKSLIEEEGKAPWVCKGRVLMSKSNVHATPRPLYVNVENNREWSIESSRKEEERKFSHSDLSVCVEFVFCVYVLRQ